jgi:hypothetical protein
MAAEKTDVFDGKALIQIGAETARALKSSAPEALDLLERYTLAFDKWQVRWQKKGSLSDLPAKDRDIIRRVANQHSAIVELTEEMLGSVERSLKELKGWSKGIRAYVDHLPKRVSTIKTRRG